MPARPAERRLRAVSAVADVDPRAAAREAWKRIAAAFDEALAIDGLSEDDRALFTRCRRNARHCAGLRCLGSAPSTATATMGD